MAAGLQGKGQCRGWDHDSDASVPPPPNTHCQEAFTAPGWRYFYRQCRWEKTGKDILGEFISCHLSRPLLAVQHGSFVLVTVPIHLELRKQQLYSNLPEWLFGTLGMWQLVNSHCKLLCSSLLYCFILLGRVQVRWRICCFELKCFLDFTRYSHYRYCRLHPK